MFISTVSPGALAQKSCQPGKNENVKSWIFQIWCENNWKLNRLNPDTRTVINPIEFSYGWSKLFMKVTAVWKDTPARKRCPISVITNAWLICLICMKNFVEIIFNNVSQYLCLPVPVFRPAVASFLHDIQCLSQEQHYWMLKSLISHSVSLKY